MKQTDDEYAKQLAQAQQRIPGAVPPQAAYPVASSPSQPSLPKVFDPSAPPSTHPPPPPPPATSQYLGYGMYYPGSYLPPPGSDQLQPQQQQQHQPPQQQHQQPQQQHQQPQQFQQPQSHRQQDQQQLLSLQQMTPSPQMQQQQQQQQHQQQQQQQRQRQQQQQPGQPLYKYPVLPVYANPNPAQAAALSYQQVLQTVQQQAQAQARAQAPVHNQALQVPIQLQAPLSQAPPSQDLMQTALTQVQAPQAVQVQGAQARVHAHARSHSRSSERASIDGDLHKCYTCPQCPWSFARHSDLRRHMRSHQTPKYRCPYWHPNFATCPRGNGGTFARLDVLKRHLKLVHFAQEPELLADGYNGPDAGLCLACGRCFNRTKDFLAHVQECAQVTPIAKWRFKRNGIITNVRKEPLLDLSDGTLGTDAPLNIELFGRSDMEASETARTKRPAGGGMGRESGDHKRR